MGQTITLLNTNTINLTKALSVTQGLFLCLVHTIANTITLGHINTMGLTMTLSHTLCLTPRNTNTPTMESPPWEFCPHVGI